MDSLCSYYSWVIGDLLLVMGSINICQAEQGVEDRLVEIAVERLRAQEFDGQARRTDERAQNPRKLTAQEEVARQPPDKR